MNRHTTVLAVALAVAATTASAGDGADHKAVCEAIGADDKAACVERQREALGDVRAFLREHGVLAEGADERRMNLDNLDTAHAWMFGQCALRHGTEAGLDAVGVRACIDRQMVLFKRMKQVWADKQRSGGAD